MPIHIDTYKIEEIGEEVVVLGGNPQQVINEQHAMLIKMIRRRKNIYYITHIVWYKKNQENIRRLIGKKDTYYRTYYITHVVK